MLDWNVHHFHQKIKVETSKRKRREIKLRRETSTK